MRLTPLDIRKQEFKKAMRGLDAEEVHAFLATIADEYEAVLNDNKALRERLLELDDKVQEYRNMEKTLRDTLLTAERATAEAKDNARREGELIIKQAEIDAEKGVRDIKQNAMKLRQEIQSLRRQRDSYLVRMKMLAESQMKFLEDSENDFKEDDDLVKEAERRVSKRIDDTTGIARSPEPVAPAPVTPAPVAPAPVAPAPVTPAPVEPAAPAPVTPKPATSLGSAQPTSITPAPLKPAPAHVPHPPLADREAGKALGSTMTLEESDAPLSELLDQVIEGQKMALDEVAAGEVSTEMPWLTDTATSTTADEATPHEPAPAKTDRRVWSLERLRGEIAGDAGKKDETN